MLKIDHIGASYGETKALWDVSLEVHEGKILALLGPNAAGKSTTLRAVSGIVPVDEGSITFQGNPIHGLAPNEIVDLGIVHVPEGRGLFGTLTVQENLELGAYTPRARKHMRETINQVYDRFPALRERAKRLASSLSGGEQQMCAIGRGLMARPKLLMIDEMSLGLAPMLVQTMFDIVQEIVRSGITVLVVEQQVHKTLTLADTAYILEKGRTVLSGTAAEVAKNEHVRGVYLGL